MRRRITRILVIVGAAWTFIPFVALGPDVFSAVAARIPQASLPVKYVTAAGLTYYLSGMVWGHFWYVTIPILLLMIGWLVLGIRSWTGKAATTSVR